MCGIAGYIGNDLFYPKKKNDQISHEESKFLFICLNIAILEKNVY